MSPSITPICSCAASPCRCDHATVPRALLRRTLEALRVARELLAAQELRTSRLESNVEAERADAMRLTRQLARVPKPKPPSPSPAPAAPLRGGPRKMLMERNAALEKRVRETEATITRLHEDFTANKAAARDRRGRELGSRFMILAEEQLAPELFAELLGEARGREGCAVSAEAAP